MKTALMAETMRVSEAWLAAAILVGAGLYQLTPLKGACLTHCRSPLGFLMTNWRDGTVGALRMGTRHGMFCVGCCWAVMAVMFVVGIMNLPSNIEAAAFSLAATAGGAIKAIKTTPLMTIQEGITAMKKAAAAGYMPPAATAGV